jgi:glycosyltransferase involved in cell wall biosynthesis
VVDADLILSRLMQQAWEKNKSFQSRYYLIQSLKLEQYEKKLYQNDFTFLFSNEEECLIINEQYRKCKTQYLANTTDLVPKMPSTSTKRIILMYGVMNSIANIDAYNYLENELYERIENKLEVHNYEIHIVGKGCAVLTPSKHERIKILGKVDSMEATLVESSFVLLPIYIASGTNTRVLETAMVGRALITTPLGMEGLINQKGQEYIAQNLDEMVAKIGQMMEDNTYRIEMAELLQQNIMNEFSYEKFEKSLFSIMKTSQILDER